MKKILFALICAFAVLATGCQKENETNFNYDVNILYGTWRVTDVYVDGDWMDITTPIAELVFKPTYATFNPDMTYSGKGAFGNGEGTYSLSGDTIYTYVDGEEYLTYKIRSLNGSFAELEVLQSGEAVTAIKVEKQ